MEHRIYTLEDRVAGLRERVASLEAGLNYSKRLMDQSNERAELFDAALTEIRRDRDTTNQRFTQSFQELNSNLSVLKSGLDTHTTAATDRKEALRYYRSLLVPAVAGLVIWAITGNLELVKLLLGIK